MEQEANRVVFVTGNAGKLKEITAILSPYMEVQGQNIDLPELQGTAEDIVREKVKIASQQIQPPLFVEDTSLCFNAMGGLPGPYIKWFWQKMGFEGIKKSLEGFGDSSAYTQCSIGYIEKEGDEPIVFVGKTSGKFVQPRGVKVFGWDACFQPDGFEQTYAELDPAVKNAISHRGKAFVELAKYLETKRNSSYNYVKVTHELPVDDTFEAQPQKKLHTEFNNL